MEKRDLSYGDMTKGGVYEDSEVPAHNPPYENDYEKRIPGSNGIDHSGMKRG